MGKFETAFSSAERAQSLLNSTAIPSRRGSQRSGRVMAKAAQRKAAARKLGGLSFAKLAGDPIYQRMAHKVCPAPLAETVTGLGFDSAAALASAKTVAGVKARMRNSASQADFSDAALRDVLRDAKREATRVYRLMRHNLAVQDPMNQVLRHTPSTLSPTVDLTGATQTVSAFAKPTSLQSNQSPAAYLRYLYRIAAGLDPELGILTEDGSPYAIAARRPDLAKLALNEANLKKEVPTLELVNEVLEAGLQQIDMGAAFFPIALPYDHRVATTRAALSQIGGTQLNDIATRTQSPLSFDGARPTRWAVDIAGLLGLLDASDGAGVIGLISERQADAAPVPTTLEELFQAETAKAASTVDHLMTSLDLDFDGLVQLLGLYSVSQEAGDSAAQRDFATAFLGNEAAIELISVGGEGPGQTTAVTMAGAPLSAPDLRALHYLARLHHGTGLAFHQLNTILSVPGASAASGAGGKDATQARQHVTEAGLRLLASYPLYQATYGLTSDAFAALFDVLSPYWRADQVVDGVETTAGLEQTEISFLRTVFGDDAPFVQMAVQAGDTPISDSALQGAIARGLGLSKIELDRLADMLEAPHGLRTGVDAQGLGALYRLRTLCEMLDWPVLQALDLLEQLSQQPGVPEALVPALVARNGSPAETLALCDAVDWLVALSGWMQEAELSLPQLLAIITPATAEIGLVAQDDLVWRDGVADAFRARAATPAIFAEFAAWESAVEDNVGVAPETWHRHLLEIDPVYRSTGVFLPQTSPGQIEAACRNCLTAAGIDPDQGGNAAQLQLLVAQLAARKEAQTRLILDQIASMDAAVNGATAEALIAWVQTTPLDLLDRLLRGATEAESLFWLAEIRRHLAAATALDLGEVDLWMLAHRPDWLSPDVINAATGQSPLSLAQLYALQRFATIQVGAASDAAWRGYLARTNEHRPDAAADAADLQDWTTGCRETLALLIGCPPEDAAAYLDALYGAGHVPTDVAQLDALARHVRLADELGLSAAQLLQLKAATAADGSADWAAAAAAAQAGLARFDGAQHVPGFRKALAEHHRDALVAAFMQTKIKDDQTLRANVTDREALYQYLLLDVNVSSAVPTSRIVEAISTLQLFISRALSGLETVSFADRSALAQQWELDKEYRQWEANQKLELYPQNYIEPELRQITSPEFETLLQAVTGGDVNPDSVEAAVNAYMNGLAGLCDLSLCSLYAERQPTVKGVENTTYHVLAKAKWEPGRFFYRQLK